MPPLFGKTAETPIKMFSATCQANIFSDCSKKVEYEPQETYKTHAQSLFAKG